MSFVQQQIQLWILLNIETNFGRQQSCMNCSKLTKIRFEVCDPKINYIRRMVCSSCAETITGYSKTKMDICERYIKSTKSQYRDLKNLNGKCPPKQSHPKVKNYFNLMIGDRKIFITEFHSGKFMMMINDERISPEADFLSFKNQKQVTARAFHFINNYYIDCMLHFVINGVHFKMP